MPNAARLACSLDRFQLDPAFDLCENSFRASAAFCERMRENWMSNRGTVDSIYKAAFPPEQYIAAIWAATIFRRSPHNILGKVLDIKRLAVRAVPRINDEGSVRVTVVEEFTDHHRTNWRSSTGTSGLCALMLPPDFF